VPTVEKIGALRQTATPEPGHEYWMVFSNPGKLVKQGTGSMWGRPVRLEGLIVEYAAPVAGQPETWNHDEEGSADVKAMACELPAAGLAVGWYAPEAGAVKVVRDPSVSPAPQPPKVAQPAPTPPRICQS